MRVYKTNSLITKKSNRLSVNLTKSITENIEGRESIRYYYWNLLLDNEKNLQIEISFTGQLHDALYSKKVEINFDSTTIVTIPTIITKIFEFRHKDVLRLEHYKEDNISTIKFRTIKNVRNIEEVKDLKVLTESSKLRLYNNPEISLPRKIRLELSIEIDDIISVSLYKNEENQYYLELLKLDELINNYINNDKLIYRTIEKVSMTGTVYYIKISKFLQEKLEIQNKTTEYWGIYLNKINCARLTIK